jgi:hypothetical protein
MTGSPPLPHTATQSQIDTRVKIYSPIAHTVLLELCCGVGALLCELGIAMCQLITQPLSSKARSSAISLACKVRCSDSRSSLRLRSSRSRRAARKSPKNATPTTTTATATVPMAVVALAQSGPAAPVMTLTMAESLWGARKFGGH